MDIPTPRRRRRAAVLSCAVVLLTSALAGAGRDDDVLERAAAIVADATSGLPLDVVAAVTTPGDGLRIATRRAADPAEALVLVVAALRDDSVEAVSIAREVRASATRDTLRDDQWALDRLRAESVWRTTRGQATRSTRRAVVAVVDTGVDARHPDLRGNVLDGLDTVDRGTSAADENGHGTHVAGTVAAVAGNGRGVAGLAPKAAVLPVRVLGADGSGRSDNLARGIVWAADKKAHVVNMSLSYTGRDAVVERAVQHARSRGSLVVAAAGNSGCPLLFRPVQYPAALPGVVGVGSIDRNGNTSSFSSCGDWVDVAAPGGSIMSTMTTRNRVGCGGVSYCRLDGTSMAAPHVAAAAAVTMARRGRSATTVARALERTATDRGPAGKDQTYGAGVLDPVALLR